MRFLFFFVLLLTILSVVVPERQPRKYDLIIRGGTLYDGSGTTPFVADIGIRGDSIAAIGSLKNFHSGHVIDATGLAVAPGFINMLSWADESLLESGYSESGLKQGVTLEVLGEGFSPGPVRRGKHAGADSLWTTLDGYFRYLSKKGISTNVASFVGATSVRIYEMGYTARRPSGEELERMKGLVQEAMEDGAMGLSTSLIYPPAAYAETAELIALAKVASRYGGIYITHMRSEGDFILPAINETIRISKEADIPAEIYHLKVNLSRNWNKIDTVLQKIDSARDAGIPLTANMYPYTASGTGLNARLPAWVHEGGAQMMRARLQKRGVRKRALYEMEQGIPAKNSDPESVVLMRFRLEGLNKRYRGKTLLEASRIYGKSPDETAMDLVILDRSRIEALYYLQSEAVMQKVLQRPYVSFGSDGGSYTLGANHRILPDHPRAFGTFACVLGKYVREKKALTLAEAIRRMSALPAANLKLERRGNLKPGCFADIVMFDPMIINDEATYENPNLYATGMVHVFVNGVQVLNNGAHTAATPGRIVRGPGWIRK